MASAPESSETPHERAKNTRATPQPAVIPDDHLAAHGPIAPPDKDESPREQHIVTTDPHRALAPEEDDDWFNEFDNPGEGLDLHQVHAVGTSAMAAHTTAPAAEAFRPVPWWAIGVAGLLVAWGGIYLGQYNGGWQGDVFNEEANYHPVSGPPRTRTRRR